MDMDYFKNMIYKNGKLDYGVIAVKGAFFLLAIIYTILFFVAKNISIGSYLYPANDYFFFHLIMFIPAIACIAFVILAHSTDWLRVLWQMVVIMTACLVIIAGASVFGGLKSETDKKSDYLVLDSYLSENDALDPEGEDTPEGTTLPTFEQTVKQLMPATLDNTKSADYKYDYTSLPILGGYFDVALKAKYNDDNFAAEISRLEKQYGNCKKLADKDDNDLTHYIIRANDNPGSYFYVSYSVAKHNTIYYYVCYADRSSATPLFEKDGFDLGRVGEIDSSDANGK